MKPVATSTSELNGGSWTRRIQSASRVSLAESPMRAKNLISCNQLTDDEMAKIVKTKRIWMRLFIGEGRPITPNLASGRKSVLSDRPKRSVDERGNERSLR